jgi:hypothetical protein
MFSSCLSNDRWQVPKAEWVCPNPSMDDDDDDINLPTDVPAHITFVSAFRENLVLSASILCYTNKSCT